jgi:hypothetical protein
MYMYVHMYTCAHMQSLYVDIGEPAAAAGDSNGGSSSCSTFFEETERFWHPAGDRAGLYQQLANKKYREILRTNVQ